MRGKKHALNSKAEFFRWKTANYSRCARSLLTRPWHISSDGSRTSISGMRQMQSSIGQSGAWNIAYLSFHCHTCIFFSGQQVSFKDSRTAVKARKRKKNNRKGFTEAQSNSTLCVYQSGATQWAQDTEPKDLKHYPTQKWIQACQPAIKASNPELLDWYASFHHIKALLSTLNKDVGHLTSSGTWTD